MKNLIIYIVAASLVLMSCKDHNQAIEITVDENESSNIIVEGQQFNNSNFELGTTLEHEFSSSLKVSGEIHLPEKSQAAINSLLDGIVGEVNWIEGQWVKKGTTLFTITNPELINMQEEYLVLQGELVYLREEYARQGSLAADKITTQKDLLKAKSELVTSEARYNALKKKLDLYGINVQQLNISNLVSTIPVVAPISGYVTEINVVRGSYLESSKTALVLQNTNHIHLELSVLEKDAHLLKKNQEISFSLQNDPTRKFNGHIHLINKIIGDNHMVQVHGHIENENDINLMPGMYVNAAIILGKKREIALPKDALVKLENDWIALKLVSKSDLAYEFEKVVVEVGATGDVYTQVINLPLDGQQYLTKGSYFLIY